MEKQYHSMQEGCALIFDGRIPHSNGYSVDEDRYTININANEKINYIRFSHTNHAIQLGKYIRFKF